MEIMLTHNIKEITNKNRTVVLSANEVLEHAKNLIDDHACINTKSSVHYQKLVESTSIALEDIVTSGVIFDWVSCVSIHAGITKKYTLSQLHSMIEIIGQQIENHNFNYDEELKAYAHELKSWMIHLRDDLREISQEMILIKIRFFAN